MKDFSLLKDIQIVMISDYVNPKAYSREDLIEESNFIDRIKKEISRYDIQFMYVEVKDLSDIKNILKRYSKNNTLIFNWCEFLEEKEDTAYLVTGLLEKEGFRFTGSDSRCLKLTSGKRKTKEKLMEKGVPTPRYKIFSKTTSISEDGLNFPVILKLENRHSSVGLTGDNVVYSRDQLTRVSDRLLNRFDSDLVAEEFIEGQEYAVTVWGNTNESQILTCGLLNYKDKNKSKTYTQASKEDKSSGDYENTVITVLDNTKDKGLIDKVAPTVLSAYKALAIFDYARFEVIEKDGIFYVIDCNPNEYIGTGSFIYDGAAQFGYNSGETLLQICKFAVKRYMQ